MGTSYNDLAKKKMSVRKKLVFGAFFARGLKNNVVDFLGMILYFLTLREKISRGLRKSVEAGQDVMLNPERVILNLVQNLQGRLVSASNKTNKS